MDEKKAKALEFLTDFIKRYVAQDNYGTAFPFYVALQVKEQIVVDGDFCHDSTVYRHPDFFESTFNSIEEFREFVSDYFGRDYENLDETIKEKEEELVKHYLKDVWEDREIFLTMDAYNDHLKLNSHNYRKEIRPYIKHAFRSPELLTLLKSIAALADIELRK